MPSNPEVLYNRFQEPQALPISAYSQPYPQQPGFKSRFVFPSGVTNPNSLSKVEMPPHPGTYPELYSGGDAVAFFLPLLLETCFLVPMKKILLQERQENLCYWSPKARKMKNITIWSRIPWAGFLNPTLSTRRSVQTLLLLHLMASSSRLPHIVLKIKAQVLLLVSHLPSKPQQHSQSNSRAQSPPTSTNNAPVNKGARSNSNVQPPVRKC